MKLVENEFQPYTYPCEKRIRATKMMHDDTKLEEEITKFSFNLEDATK